MANDVNEMISKFFTNFDTYEYPQPAVADAIAAAQTDLNSWRKRELLFASGWLKGGRILYTARGVIYAGIFNEVAWLLGPKLAKEIADSLLSYVSDVAEGRRDAWEEDVICFNRPIERVYDHNRPRLEVAGEGDQYEQSMGFPLSMVKQADFAGRKIEHRTTVVMPLGSLIRKWAYGAQARVSKVS